MDRTRKKRNGQEICYSLRSFNCIHKEISEFNNNYWSKFLLLFLFSIITVMNNCLYQALFGEINTFIKFVFLYLSITFSSILLIILLSASSVSSEAKKSYKILIKSFPTINTKILIHLKVMSFIEKAGQKRLDFIAIDYLFLITLLYMK